MEITNETKRELKKLGLLVFLDLLHFIGTHQKKLAREKLSEGTALSVEDGVVLLTSAIKDILHAVDKKEITFDVDIGLTLTATRSLLSDLRVKHGADFLESYAAFSDKVLNVKN